VPRTVKPAKKRQEEILLRPVELFARQGYENMSIQDIIGAVGIAKGTFYHHFRSKEDLLDRLIDSTLAEAVDTLERSGPRHAGGSCRFWGTSSGRAFRKAFSRRTDPMKRPLSFWG
jgi:AcrR family transcriptional regulator